MSLYLLTFAASLNKRRAFATADIELSLAVVLIACVGLFTVFTWQPILLRRPISWASFRPVLVLTLSSLLQATFIVLVGRNLLTLDYSLKFAALGLPLCFLALVLANRRKGANDLPRGTVICVSLGLVMWIFLTTAH